jgi:hypothetical protein
MPTVSSAVKTAEAVAQQLQKRRESYVKTLEALPMPKARVPEFPYASMEAGEADGWKLIDNGPEGAYALLLKGYKTSVWRKTAEKNRVARDEAAEGQVTGKMAARVAKAASAASAEK